ncbi:MAG: YggU family protein [Nitrospirae bacterium]|nr:YggU family protein [Nitrospirota bacterium]
MPDIPPLDLREDASGVVLKVSVQPKASRNKLAGIHDRALRLRLTAPPIEGAANAACLAFLAQLFRIQKSRIRIIRGHRSRQKWVRMEGLTRAGIMERLGIP